MKAIYKKYSKYTKIFDFGHIFAGKWGKPTPF